MKKIEDIRTIQNLEYSMLEKFDKFCLEKNLKYFLVGGTLLGAIRHKGFIPWDDDIDLAMPRPDYMKLLELLKVEKISDEIEADSKYLGSKNPTTMLRIFNKNTKVFFKEYSHNLNIGLWIDIFPLDGVPQNSLKRKIHFYKHRLLMDCYICSITKLGSQRRNIFLTYFQYLLTPIYFIFNKIGFEFWIKLLEKNNLKYSYETSELIGVIEGRAVVKETMSKKEFIKEIHVKFENKKFPIPGCFDYYLRQLYGNYMELPPEDKRNSRHDIEVYIKEN